MGHSLSTALDTATKLDIAATHWLQRQVQLGPAELLILPGSKGFGWRGFPVALGLVAVIHGRQQLSFTLLSMALGQIVSRLFKGWALRIRPRPPAGGVRRFLTCVLARPGQHLRFDGDGPAFPSGDAMSAGAIGMSLAIAQNEPLYLALPLNAVIARSYFMYHWLGDTVVGALIGIVASLAVQKLYKATGHADGWREITPKHVLTTSVIFIAVMRSFHQWDKAALVAAAKISAESA